jgi:hypothetical protein
MLQQQRECGKFKFMYAGVVATAVAATAFSR